MPRRKPTKGQPASSKEPRLRVGEKRSPVKRSPAEIRLYGVHAVAAALANPSRICRLLMATAESAKKLSHRFGNLPEKVAVDVAIVPRGDIERLLPDGAVHQGLLLEADPLPPADASRLLAAEKRPLVFLDRVTDPQNVGAVLRSAAAFGAGAVLLPARHAPADGGALAKAASGALEIVPLVRLGNLAAGLRQAKARGYWCIGLDPTARATVDQAKDYDRVALVLGAEGTGLRRLTRDHCDVLVRLPMSGPVNSLNVAAAAAVALFAFRE